MARRQPHQADTWVEVESYPSLDLLCWNLATPRITRRDAFAIYERNWRYRGLSSCLAAVPDTNDHRCFAIDSVSQHVGSGAEPHGELTAVGTVSEGATEFRQFLKPARAIQDGAHGACRSGGILPDQKVMEPLDIVKCFGQPQDARQSPAFPAAAFANAFSRMAASS